MRYTPRFYATIEHFRLLAVADNMHLQYINNRGFDKKVAKKIAHEYSILRTIEKGNLDKIVFDINNVGNEWYEKSLDDKVKTWLKIARKNEKKVITKDNYRTPYSAISKLLWFRYPDSGWTMYDSLARSGLNKINKERGCKPSVKPLNFYKKIEEVFQFSSLVDEINLELNNHYFPKLYAERIIDKYLMFKGMKIDERHDRFQGLEYFINYHLIEFQKELLEVSCAISDIIEKYDTPT